MPGKVLEDFIVLSDGTTPALFNSRISALESAPPGSVSDPNPQSYTPGSFSVVTGKYVILCNHLQLTTSQRATLAGTSRMRIL